MGLFGNLFGNKQEDNGLVVDLIDNGFVINDTRFPFPARASELVKVLGIPRVVEQKIDDSLRRIYSEKYGFDEKSYQPLLYYWDEYGFLAYTHDHETVHNFTISLHSSKYPIKMPNKFFTGKLLSHGNLWHEEVIKQRGGSLQYDKCYATVHSWGNYKKEKNIGHLEYKSKGDKLDFFELSDEARKILSFVSEENIGNQEFVAEESDIYIMDKYWDSYIGGSDDSMTLMDYLADKKSKDISLKEIFTELGFNQDDFDFRNPRKDITVTLKNGVNLEFHYAIQVICDLTAILLECKKNKSVNLQVLSGGMLEKDKVVIRLSTSEKEEKIIHDVLTDFCKNPMEYNLREMCTKDDMKEMVSLCEKLKNEYTIAG